MRPLPELRLPAGPPQVQSRQRWCVLLRGPPPPQIVAENTHLAPFHVWSGQKDGLPLTRLSHPVCPAKNREADWPDRRVPMRYWQVGAGRILVVWSVRIWGTDHEFDTMRRALTPCHA